MAKRVRQYGECYTTVEIYQATVAPGTISPGTQVQVTVTLPTGNTAAVGDYVTYSTPVSLFGLNLTPNINSAGVITVNIFNGGLAGVALASSTWTFAVHKLARI